MPLGVEQINKPWSISAKGFMKNKQHWQGGVSDAEASRLREGSQALSHPQGRLEEASQSWAGLDSGH